MLDAIAEINQITAGPRPLSQEHLLRLAVLRHTVGARKIQETPKPEPPNVPDDLFPGVVGAAEISGAELTGAHVASGLHHHGALVVRGLINPDDVERLIGLIDGKDWSAPQFPPDGSGEPCPGSTPMKCSTATLQGLIEAYENAGMNKVMGDYFGEAPVLLSERLQVDRQILKTGLPWHQDGAFFGSHVGAVNSFLALDDCGVDATGLMIVTQRFDEILGVAPGERAPLGYGSAFKHEDILEMVGEDRVVTPVLQPGDAILFDEMTMHRTGAPPRQPRERSWAITWFFAPSRFPEQRHPLWLGS